MRHFRNRMLRLALSLAIAGTITQIGGCSFSDAISFVRNFNYGETVLGMDAVAYQFYTSGYEGPGVNPDIDPACTYPPYCTGDPFAPVAP